MGRSIVADSNFFFPDGRISWFIRGVPDERRAQIPFQVFAAALVLAVGLAFWVPALGRTGGRFPVPLDDVYIHFGFARSAALGHPFAWLPENGYSSGGTSLVYPLLLAPGWLLGFRGASLAWFSAALTLVCLFDLCRSARALLGSSKLAAWLAAPLLLSVPLVDWSLYSGMETALFAALLGRTLCAADRATRVGPSERVGAQLRAGIFGALLVATRPESAAFVLPLGVAIVYAARSLGTIASLARTLAPTGIFLVAQAGANLALTGELGQAGAVRKLVGTNPYLTPIQAAVEVIKNLAVLRVQAFDVALGGSALSLALLSLVVVAVLSRRTRLVAMPLAAGALGMLLLVSLNTTARYQNFRYAVPSLLMVLVGASLGAAELVRSRSRVIRGLGVGLALASILAPARRFPRQIDHFRRASANIEEQQAEVGRRLGAMSPRPRRVLVGDAGAIPYLSGLSALDGLGLGGYHDLPFARASVHGVPAVIELIERMPEAERPDVMAIYPSWFPELADSFGSKLFSVRIEDNVICAAPEKVVFAADWSSLSGSGEARAGAVDELDVADLVDERAHGYTFPRPQGGWVIGARLRDEAGRSRFDAGRIVPQGEAEAFVVTKSVEAGPATLALRLDAGGPMRIRVEVSRGGIARFGEDVAIGARVEGAWSEVQVALSEVRGGDEVRITAVESAWRSFHAWLLRP